MKRYASITGALLAFFLLLFFLVEVLKVPLLTDPSPWLKQRGALAAVIGVGLLLVDVFLPVPSSVVMIAHGALFGVVVGTLLSLAGSTGAALLGFAIGRRGGPLLARLVPLEQRRRADMLLSRWGALAIVVTRPLPLLAETVAILAGASPLPLRHAALAAFAGSLPAALLYALTGAGAASFSNAVLMFGLVILIAGGFFVVGRRLEQRLTAGRGQNSTVDKPDSGLL